jgi:capsular exopolysaccharide synthesis family protein
MAQDQQDPQTGPNYRGPANPVNPASTIGTTAALIDTPLSESLLVLRKRKWVLIAAVILGIAYGYYVQVTMPKVYIATGRLQVREGSSNEYRVTAVGETIGGSINRMDTEVNILSSETLLLSVARSLNLQDNLAFNGFKTPQPHRDLDDPAVRESVLKKLRTGLTIKTLLHTDLIDINYKSPDPDLSTKVVNQLMQTYISHSFQSRYASTERITDWLSSQLDDLKQQVETSQEQLMDLQKRVGVIGLDNNQSQIIGSQLQDLNKAATEARVERIIAEAHYRILSDANPNATNLTGLEGTTTGQTSMTLSNLRQQYATLSAQLAQMNTVYGPNYPQEQALKAQLADLQDEINKEQLRNKNEAQQLLQTAKTNEQMTGAALAETESDAYKMRDDIVEYTIREREFESNRELYQGLQEKLHAAGIEAGLESSEIDIVDLAYRPASPTLPTASSTIITRLVFFLLAGIVLVFVLENLDTGLRSIYEIETLTELPSLAMIPKAKRYVEADDNLELSQAHRNIYVLSAPKSHFSESFRSLRTSLLLSTAGRPPKVILVTSATPSEGKTTISTNLACVMAQRDSKVLLIDCDLRRPTVHHRFGLTGKTGLTTVLTGAARLQDVVQRVPELPNLDILTSGPVPPFPTEMLGSAAFTALLEEASQHYTHVVLDSPPILSVTDGVMLARMCDAVALVIRHGKTSKHVVRRARDLLIRAGAPITGIVLNAVDLNSPEYYGYYGYYNYGYYSNDSSSWDTLRDRVPGSQPDI